MSQVVSDEYTVHGVDASTFRFGVQFEKECPGVLLREYAEESADDAMVCANHCKPFGLSWLIEPVGPWSSP